jgi:hypothetical protein
MRRANGRERATAQVEPPDADDDPELASYLREERELEPGGVN